MELEKNSKLYLSDNISMIPSDKEKNYPNNKNIIKNIILLTLVILFAFFLYFFFKHNIFFKINKSNQIKSLSIKQEKKYEIDSNYERISPNDEKYIYIPIIAGKIEYYTSIQEINIFNLMKLYYSLDKIFLIF